MFEIDPSPPVSALEPAAVYAPTVVPKMAAHDLGGAVKMPACSICGGMISRQAKFCTRCGGRLAAEPWQHIPLVSSASAQSPASVRKSPFSGKLVVAAAALLALVIALAVHGVDSDEDKQKRDPAYAEAVQKQRDLRAKEEREEAELRAKQEEQEKWESDDRKAIVRRKVKEYIEDRRSKEWSLSDWRVVHEGNGIYVVSVTGDLDLRSFGRVH
jgi:hypothetical protein